MKTKDPFNGKPIPTKTRDPLSYRFYRGMLIGATLALLGIAAMTFLDTTAETCNPYPGYRGPVGTRDACK